MRRFATLIAIAATLVCLVLAGSASFPWNLIPR
jgi:hypothetical protein